MSSLRINSNVQFRAIKALPETVLQTEYNGNDIDTKISCPNGLVAIKAHDDGVLLLMLTSKARGIYGWDKLVFDIDSDTLDNVPKCLTIHLHGKSYSMYDFKLKTKISIEPSPLEVGLIKWFEDNDKLSKLFTGVLELEQDFANKQDEIAENCFRGNWCDTPSELPALPELLQTAVTAYASSSNDSSGNKKEWKVQSYQSKLDDKVTAVGKLAWFILYPAMPLPSVVDTLLTVDLVTQLQESKKLDILHTLLPNG